MKKISSPSRKARFLLTVFWLCMLGGGADAQPVEELRTVVVIGSASIQGGQATAARDAAVANSLMNAVALTAIDSFSPEVIAENFKMLQSYLLDKPDEFIKDFRVLSETVVAKQHRVMVQTTVRAKAVRERITAAGLTGGLPAGGGAGPVVLIVEGSGNLANFVKFRKALGGIQGVESIQVRDIKPNETTLIVAYRGGLKDLSAALAQHSFDSFAISVADAGEDALRAVLSSK
jgi:hypothetical protein